MKVSGVGSLLGLNWGPVTVQVAINGLEQLAQLANSKKPGAAQAKNLLAQLQQDMYIAGAYGSKQPTHGSIGIADITAFKKMAVGAAASGQGLDQYVYTTASAAQANGTVGAGTTVLTPPHIQEKVWSPQDIQATLDATETATGQNFAQKLIGRDFNQQQLQGIADVLNSAAGQQANADVAAADAQQQEQMQAYGATSGPPTNTAGSVTANGPPGIDQFLAAVKQHESGGSYTANSGDGAYGAYQFIPSTWNSEAKAAGYGQYANGRADKAPPAVQDAVAHYMAQNLYNGMGKSWEMAARGWYDPAKANDPNYAPPGNNGLTIGQYGKDIVQLMGQQPSQGTQAGGATAAGFFAPTGKGLTQGRTDQGVDFSGKGALFAVGSGTVVKVEQNDPGWGGAWLAVKLDNPPDAAHSIVYYAEGLTPNVKVGQHVAAGTQVGTATGASTGIEIGWGDPSGAAQALTRSLGKSYTEGVPTAEGQDFLNFIQGGANINGTAQYNGKNVVFQQPIVDQVPATLDPTAAAQQYVEQNMPSDFQANNLFKIFDALNTHFGAALPSSDTPGKPRSTPITMK